jgi:hypothetical protein
LPVNFFESTPTLNKVQSGLVLVPWLEAGQLQLLGHSFPGLRQELIGPSCSAGVALHDHPLGMTREVLKLPSAIRDLVALIFTVLPGPLGEANGVEQGAALRRQLITPTFVAGGQMGAAAGFAMRGMV